MKLMLITASREIYPTFTWTLISHLRPTMAQNTHSSSSLVKYVLQTLYWEWFCTARADEFMTTNMT